LEFDCDDGRKAAGQRHHRHGYAERHPEHPTIVGRSRKPLDQSRRARRRGQGQCVLVQPRRGRPPGTQAVGKAQLRGVDGHAGPEAGHGRGQFREERGAKRYTQPDRVGEEEQRGLYRKATERRDRQGLEEQEDQHHQLVPRLRAEPVVQPRWFQRNAVRRQAQHHQLWAGCAAGPDRTRVRQTLVRVQSTRRTPRGSNRHFAVVRDRSGNRTR